MQQHVLLSSLSAFAFAVAAAVAESPWTVTVLRPTGHQSGMALAAAGRMQVGTSFSSQYGENRATLWRGAADSAVDLHPAGPGFQSFAFGTDGIQQVGMLYGQWSPGVVSSRALMWTGTAQSAIDLTPTGSTNAVAHAVQGGQQVGIVNYEAALWSGDRASYVNLTPGRNGRAYAVHSGRQGGCFVTGTGWHAALWSGTADSIVDLHPAGAGQSEIRGMDRTQQVGFASFDYRPAAALWTGTAESFVNLAGPTVEESVAYAAFNGYQVGYATPLFTSSWYSRPTIWQGTSESMEFLPFPEGYWSGPTAATGIWADDTTLYVSGFAVDQQREEFAALLWTRPIPSPTSMAPLSLAALFAVRRRRA